MNELESLNMLLRLVGFGPVNSISSKLPIAVNAKATLNRVRKKMQIRGWWFNLDYNVLLQPETSTREIMVTRTYTSIVSEIGYVVRKGKLYDAYNQTYQFAGPVLIKTAISELEWDEMPDSMQMYCSYMAGAEFVRDEIEDENKANSLVRDAGLVMIEIKREDLANGQYNIFDRARIRRARQGQRPVSRR